MNTPAALLIAAGVLFGGALFPATANAQHWNHAYEAPRHHYQPRHHGWHGERESYGWRHYRPRGCTIINERRWSNYYRAWVLEPVRICR